MSGCPFCQHPPEPHASHCVRCGQGLGRVPNGQVIPVHPPIRPGETLCWRDFRVHPLPYRWTRELFEHKDGTQRRPTEHGIQIAIKGTGHLEFAERYLNVRDVIVRGQVVLLTEGAHAFVAARFQKIDAMELGYRLDIRSDKREVTLTRIASSTDGTTSHKLMPSTVHSAVAPIGQPNLIELGVQGPTIHGFINGHHVAAFHDPFLGIGSPSIGGGTHIDTGKLAQVLWQWLEVKAVAP